MTTETQATHFQLDPINQVQSSLYDMMIEVIELNKSFNADLLDIISEINEKKPGNPELRNTKTFLKLSFVNLTLELEQSTKKLKAINRRIRKLVETKSPEFVALNQDRFSVLLANTHIVRKNIGKIVKTNSKTTDYLENKIGI